MLRKFEDWFHNQSVQKRGVVAGFVLMFLAIFGLNYLYPMAADDFLYSVVKYGESVSLVENFKEIGSFMHYYYFNWGGRVIAHIIAHILLLFNPIVQDILNSLAYCMLIYLLYKISSNGKNNFILLIVIGVSVFYFGPAFLSSAIWITGSANYLWTTVIVFAFIYPYYRFVNGHQYSNSVVRAVLFFLAGIIAAWTNENIAPVLCLIILVYTYVVYKREKNKMPLWGVAGFLGAIIGSLLLVGAPGNAVRAEAQGKELLNSFDLIISKLPYLEGAYRYFMSRQIILFFVFLLLHHFYCQNAAIKKRTIYQAMLFFIVANISLLLTIVSPSFPPRAYFSISVLLILAFSILYANIDFKKLIPQSANLIILALLLVFAAKDYFTFFRGLQFLHNETASREIVIAKAIDEGKTDVYFRAIRLDYRFEYTDLSNFYKDYYGIDVHFVELDDPRLNKIYDK